MLAWRCSFVATLSAKNTAYYVIAVTSSLDWRWIMAIINDNLMLSLLLFLSSAANTQRPIIIGTIHISTNNCINNPQCWCNNNFKMYLSRIFTETKKLHWRVILDCPRPSHSRLIPRRLLHWGKQLRWTSKQISLVSL